MNASFHKALEMTVEIVCFCWSYYIQSFGTTETTNGKEAKLRTVTATQVFYNWAIFSQM